MTEKLNPMSKWPFPKAGEKHQDFVPADQIHKGNGQWLQDAAAPQADSPLWKAFKDMQAAQVPVDPEIAQATAKGFYMMFYEVPQAKPEQAECLPFVASLNAWALDAEQHGNRTVPVSPKTLRAVAAELVRLQAAQGVWGGDIHPSWLDCWSFKECDRLARIWTSGIDLTKSADHEDDLGPQWKVVMAIMLARLSPPIDRQPSMMEDKYHGFYCDGWNDCLAALATKQAQTAQQEGD